MRVYDKELFKRYKFTLCEDDLMTQGSLFFLKKIRKGVIYCK